MPYILFVRVFNEFKPQFSSFYQNIKNHINNASLLSNDKNEKIKKTNEETNKAKEMQEKEIFIAHILEGFFI